MPPRYRASFNFRTTLDQSAAIAELAMRVEMSEAWVIRELIQQGLDRLDRDEGVTMANLLAEREDLVNREIAAQERGGHEA